MEAGAPDDLLPYLAQYQANPVLYARLVLKITTLTPDQQAILRGLVEPPRKVLVPAGHTVGKTFVSAVAVNRPCLRPEAPGRAG